MSKYLALAPNSIIEGKQIKNNLLKIWDMIDFQFTTANKVQIKTAQSHSCSANISLTQTIKTMSIYEKHSFITNKWAVYKVYCK